jgi:hypothetical protein
VTVGDPIKWRLELEGIFTIPGFGDVELAGGPGWEPGACPAAPGEAGAVAVGSAVSPALQLDERLRAAGGAL